ncbi:MULTISPECIES: tetratricopeptide repeat protein [unclassified Beijerinckia]|uniref:tetratricopeptide repeat protein n=1 Tax=unclassified Beijerinckia TaxID=2638183 RepID=UPI00147BCFCC|nr:MULTISPECIES: tetratricopeptide repeat protein [unclassified Beijerinckia]
MDNWARSTSPYVEDLLRRTLGLREGVLPADDASVANAQNQLAKVYYNRGMSSRSASDFAQGHELFAKAVATGEKHLDAKDPLLSNYYGDLGAALRELGRYSEAISYVCKSLNIRRAIGPANSLRLVGSLNNLGLIAAYQGKHLEAVQLRADALSIEQGTLGDRDPGTQALQTYCDLSIS